MSNKKIFHFCTPYIIINSLLMVIVVSLFHTLKSYTLVFIDLGIFTFNIQLLIHVITP